MVVERIICPNPEHIEQTPSCAVYEDGSMYCFGCSKFWQSGQQSPNTVPIKKYVEDLPPKFSYIESLDQVEHRGLKFHADRDGYYVVWPDKSYYKLRKWDFNTKDMKYCGAPGHKKPWFVLSAKTSNTVYISLKECVIIEGEINALSLRQAYPEIDIYCPGGVGNFTDSNSKSMLPLITQYASIYIIVDCDDVGVKAAIKFKKLIQPPCMDVNIILMEQDVNSILVDKGVEEIRRKVGIKSRVREV